MADFVPRTPEDYADTAPAAAPETPPPPQDENTQRRLSYAQWLKDNQDKVGSPDYVKMADAYRQVSDAAEAPKGNSEAFNTAVRIGTRGGRTTRFRLLTLASRRQTPASIRSTGRPIIFAASLNSTA